MYSGLCFIQWLPYPVFHSLLKKQWRIGGQQCHLWVRLSSTVIAALSQQCYQQVEVPCAWPVASTQLLTAHVCSPTVFFHALGWRRAWEEKEGVWGLLGPKHAGAPWPGFSWLTDRQPTDCLCVSMGNGVVSLRRRPWGYPSVSWGGGGLYGMCHLQD